ncbi:hypothetical protein CDL12_10445 [Handroanthus impetiginosus]|uniref:Uncharacterized protein n=1 Tax=Handroanthus impetiginosus TaxID=429701 RepID=A0A2G9HHD0_9LAMI|nr:hypothetical protein CDL12_10445 [Handroanthus impetiginosus]
MDSNHRLTAALALMVFNASRCQPSPGVAKVNFDTAIFTKVVWLVWALLVETKWDIALFGGQILEFCLAQEVAEACAARLCGDSRLLSCCLGLHPASSCSVCLWSDHHGCKRILLLHSICHVEVPMVLLTF